MSLDARAKRDCEARLHGLVSADERVLAVGTAEELREFRGEIGSGGGWTFLVLTARRLLFANWGGTDEPHQEIALDEVGG